MCLDCEFCPQTHGKQLATTKKNGFIIILFLLEELMIGQ